MTTPLYATRRWRWASSVTVALTLVSYSADAAVLCARVKKGQPAGALVLRQQCKRRETVIDPATLGLTVAGPPGPAGPAGPPGADGQLRIYGDGSAGAREVGTDETLDDDNLQYTDFTVAEGATLTVPSGTVVRCTGTFTNNGTILVATGTEGGFSNSNASSIDTAYRQAGQGVARGPAGRGERAPAGNFTTGGVGAPGLSEAEARRVLRPGVSAGGAGAAGTFIGGDGGGSLTVLAAGAIVNVGTLRADGGGTGTENQGGGAGGIIILASRERVENRGAISADGAAGGPNGSFGGPGGGGGGGIVHALAPVVDDSGTISAAGGAAGNLVATTATSFRFGGGAGGACGGEGGSGGYVGSNNESTAATPGGPGHVLQTLVDPTSLF